MSTEPKRHHYLPQFYLRGFARNGTIWVYDEQEDTFWPSSPKNTATKSHYYSLVDEAGLRDTDVEQLLAGLEGSAKPCLDALAAGSLPSQIERYRISVFLGFLACRTPAFERASNEILTSFMELIIRRNLDEPDAAGIFGHPPDELREFLDGGEFQLATGSNQRIADMIDLGPRIGRSFFEANWRVLRAPGRLTFVTSDDPFAILDPCPLPADGGFLRYGIASPEVVTSFPLSASACLLMSGEGGIVTHAPAPKAQVRRINAVTVRQTERFVIAGDERHLRTLVQTNGLGPGRHKTRMQMESYPHPSDDPVRSIVVTGRRLVAPRRVSDFNSKS